MIKCDVSPIQDRYKGTLYNILMEQGGPPRYPLSPSAIMSCFRKLSYQLIEHGAPGTIPHEPHGVRKLLVFDKGHHTEEHVCEWLSKNDTFTLVRDKHRFEVVKFEGTSITGEIDRILIDHERGISFVMDVKSTNEGSFKQIAKTMVPKESNYLQVQAYLSSPYIRNQGINHGMLYYENKNTQDFLIMEFPFVPEHAHYGIERLRYAFNNRGRVLPREHLFGESWHCGQIYCEYHEYCYNNITVPVENRSSGDLHIIQRDDLILNSFLEDKKSVDKFAVIRALLSHADGASFVYKSKTIHIEKLKTTLTVKVV